MSDQLTPNVLTVNPDGTIGATLSGHLAAKGIDLPAGISSTPSTDSRVRWLRQSDGAVLAEIYTYEDNRAQQSFQRMVLPDGSASTYITQFWDKVSQFIDVEVGTFNQAKTPVNQARTILRDDGGSDFLQLLGGAQPLYIALGQLAAVNSDANGWCHYALVQPFPTVMNVVLAQNTWAGTSNANFQVVGVVDPGHFQAFVGAAGLNCSCSFIAIGH